MRLHVANASEKPWARESFVLFRAVVFLARLYRYGAKQDAPVGDSTGSRT